MLFLSFLFFFNATATTEIYTLSLHDALPISRDREAGSVERWNGSWRPEDGPAAQGSRSPRGAGMLIPAGDRKSTRLNSSHRCISYAVFCLKKKKKKKLKR